MPTKICYFRDCSLLSIKSKVTSVIHDNNNNCINLCFDQTVFYPQGGGQPSDNGTVTIIKNNNEDDGIDAIEDLKVKKVIHGPHDDVFHLCESCNESSSVAVGDDALLQVDEELRFWHCRLHTAGHIVDAALARLGDDIAGKLRPTKGYHYEDGPYVEYEGVLEGIDKVKFARQVEDECNALISEDHTVYIDFANDDVDDTKCERCMRIGDDILSIPCGGTHVNHLKEVGVMNIRKVEMKKGKTKICYAVKKT
jgi:Ser-tRNA(Ala) deacylase AlaX